MALKGRKPNKNVPIFSHEFIIQNHADIVSCVAMVFVIGLMVQATAPISYMFIAMQHNVNQSETSNQMDPYIKYTYGSKDICAVFFYLLLCIVTHAIVQEYVLDKIIKKLHLSKAKNNKFNESGQLLAFYLFSIIWGGDIIFWENFIFNISSLWEGYPHIEMSSMLKFYFIIQMAYWLHTYTELYFQKVKKEDMLPKIKQASIMFAYILAAYIFNFSRVGILLLVLHYLSEAMYHILQLLEFFDKEENNNKVMQTVGSLASNIVFVTSRFGSIILAVLTFWFGLSQQSAAQGIDLRTMNFNSPAFRILALFSVCSLQAYLMFDFITNQIKALREVQPSYYSGSSSKKVVNKKQLLKKQKDNNELTEVDQNTKKTQRNIKMKAK
ncbi:hypothetical protein M8J76_015524 [Diaphorina citri]|nr:hypothetical protein M8J76_015524 [Diaphorina citri]